MTLSTIFPIMFPLCPSAPPHRFSLYSVQSVFRVLNSVFCSEHKGDPDDRIPKLIG